MNKAKRCLLMFLLWLYNAKLNQLPLFVLLILGFECLVIWIFPRSVAKRVPVGDLAVVAIPKRLLGQVGHAEMHFETGFANKDKILFAVAVINGSGQVGRFRVKAFETPHHVGTTASRPVAPIAGEIGHFAVPLFDPLVAILETTTQIE